MRADEFGDSKSFLESVEPFLVAHEAENCLILGIVNSLIARPDDEEVYLAAVVNEDGDVAGAAIRTVPFDLILSYGMSDTAVEVLLQSVGDMFSGLPGVLGEKARRMHLRPSGRQDTE